MSTAAPFPDPVCTAKLPLPALEQLPDDPDILKRMILELLATLHQERRDKDELRHRLDLLLRRLYGQGGRGDQDRRPAGGDRNGRSAAGRNHGARGSSGGSDRSGGSLGAEAGYADR